MHQTQKADNIADASRARCTVDNTGVVMCFVRETQKVGVVREHDTARPPPKLEVGVILGT